ncbi:terpene synthase family protein [Aspergillus foveolatus]|uniref:terpene synthase family protein n=1 Tax=Aspergillus foveolatus TaxID=210207 RepID=UPI003CCD0485
MCFRGSIQTAFQPFTDSSHPSSREYSQLNMGSMMDHNSVARLVDVKRRALFERFAESYHPTYGLGTMSGNIYDTAWVSMVRKPTEEGKSIWAFPAAFQALLQHQLPCGSWGGTNSNLDSIASTLTALLALQKHARELSATESQSELTSRILKARGWLDTALVCLNDLLATSTLTVGLELRLPTLLDLLEAEGHIFDFERTHLTKLKSKKLSKINLDTIFNGPQSSLLHSLEAMVGKIDFRALGHHKVLGSMLASPSATAAYLMYNPVWDDEAEEYIQHAISNGAGQGSGLVAAGYPTTVFEWAWVTTNLSQHDIKISSSLRQMDKQIEDEIKVHGLVGFVPKACPDADDTAKALIALHLRGRRYSPQTLIDRFEGEHHFTTYLYETHTSVSTNANVLTALVLLSDDGRYQSQIEKCIRYLCEAWFHCDRMVQDKWNISPYYPTMLMCEGLMSYIHRWSEGHLAALPDELMNFQLPITLFQALIRTLRTQNQDGSWGSSNSAEETAYAILILKSVTSFSFTDAISVKLENAIRKGIQFIFTKSQRSQTDDQLWLDKTLYAIPTVSDSYIMAAVQAEATDFVSADSLNKLVDTSTPTLQKLTAYFARLPSQTETPKWVIQASVIEGILFSRRLKKLDIFSTGKALGDKYINYAAVFWTLANNARPEYLLKMEKSLLNLPDAATDIIAGYIDKSCHETAFCNNVASHATPYETDISGYDVETRTQLINIQHNIRLWLRFALADNLQANASSHDICDLKQEVKMAMLAALQQAKAHKSLNSRQTFYAWLHTCAVHDVKSAVVSKSLICKIGHNSNVFRTAKEKYFAERLWRQMSIEGRLWNDLGSIERDRLAANLNSADFLETGPDGDVWAQLVQLADFEHKYALLCLDNLTQLLEASGRHRISLYLQMYYRCCEIYNEACANYGFGSKMAK